GAADGGAAEGMGGAAWRTDAGGHRGDRPVLSAGPPLRKLAAPSFPDADLPDPDAAGAGPGASLSLHPQSGAVDRLRSGAPVGHAADPRAGDDPPLARPLRPPARRSGALHGAGGGDPALFRRPVPRIPR